MGIPFKQIICASNENNVLTSFFNTGKYITSGRKLAATISPAIDILKSSNLERYLFHLTERNHGVVTSWMNIFNTTGRFDVPNSVSTCILSNLLS